MDTDESDARRARDLLARLLARVEMDALLLALLLETGRPWDAAQREQLREHLRGSAELMATVRADLARRRSS